VRYARVELAGWPTGEWTEAALAPRLAEASESFEAALALEPANVTAHYRLGLQARLARNFEAAAEHLAAAAAADPGHRGLTKTLGYTYVWLGDLEAALPLLRQIPEARSEMEVYSWWWGVQERPDLAQAARRMFRQLGP
jgi:tetratricopeptide (TPR) repeat protein